MDSLLEDGMAAAESYGLIHSFSNQNTEEQSSEQYPDPHDRKRCPERASHECMILS